MPLTGFLQENADSQLEEAKQISFADFIADPSSTAPRLGPGTEALLWTIMQLAEDRATVPSDKITASQIDEPLRMTWLKMREPYFVKPSVQIAGLMGNLKHAYLLRPVRGRVLTSLRLEDELGTGEFDTFMPPSGHLTDLKNVGYYKAKLILLEGVQKHGWGYWLQGNRYAQLLEGKDTKVVMGNGDRIPLLDHPAFDGKRPEVRRITLEIIPRDITKQSMAQMLNLTEVPRIIPVTLPRILPEEVSKIYRKKLSLRMMVMKDDHADICTEEEVWMKEPKKGVKEPVRCLDWCPVRDLCVDYQRSIGQPHYLDNYQIGGEK